MNYNYLDLKYSLMSIFMLDCDPAILDISYTHKGNDISIQIVLLDEGTIGDRTKKKLETALPDLRVDLRQICISKERYNENNEGWIPRHYEWLEHVLYSKSEAL